MSDRRRVLRAAVAATVMVALSGCGGPDTDRTATPSPSPTTSASPSPSPSATLEPPVAGALPVPAYPASAIPWEELGDGWFLLTYDPDWNDDVWPQVDGGQGDPELDEAVMLVSPTGGLYYVRSLAGVGNGLPIQWTGDALTILDGSLAEGSEEVTHGPLLSLTLATGAARIVNSNAEWPYILRTLPDGRVVNLWDYEGYVSVEVLGPDLTSEVVLFSTDGIATSLSPDGTRVVYLAPDGDSGSTVTLHDLSTGEGTPLDTFKYNPWSYSTNGWWDETSFVLTRWTDEGEPLRWAYDVSTKKLRDLNATLSDGTLAEMVQGAGGYRILAAGDAVEIQGFDGSLLATLPCLPTAISGTTALAVCPDWESPGQPMLIVSAHLETGTLTTVASFDAGEGAESIELRVFPAPGGEMTGLA